MSTATPTRKLAANDFWGKSFVKHSPDGKMTQGLSILTGAAAGATESFVVVPFELVKIRTIHTLRSRLPKAETPQATLFNNFISGALGGFVGTALNTPFDVVKSRIQGAHPVPGVVPKYNWTYPSLVLILREEGPAALYKGFVPKVLRLAPGGGVLLLVVEAVLSVGTRGDRWTHAYKRQLKTQLEERRMSQGDVFSRLPPEVIQHIAVAACGSTLTGPPSELAALLPVNRAIHSALYVQHNPALHARIFSVKFDARAPTRRFADAGEPLTARSFAYELRRRFICLRRIRKVSSAGKLIVCSEENLREDLWLIYLMFIESDGRNTEQLHWAKITGYLRVIVRDELMAPSKPGYLVESTTRTLGLWLMWFMTEVYAVVAETSSEISSMHALLRPWALASHKYDILCVPYTHWQLPARDEPDLGEEPVIGTPGYLADLDLRNRTEVVMHMGHRLQLAPPRASVAAIMAFMVRLERNGPIPAQPAPVIPNLPAQIQHPGHPGLTVYPRTRYPTFCGPGSTEFDGRVNRTGSATYDLEWRRILQCGNPFANLKFKAMPMFRPGDLAGHWEGRFVFLPFDAFRDMLAGVPGAVTNGPIAQQPHVWRIREHHLISRRRRIPLGRESDSVTGEKLPVGAPLDAYIPTGAQFIPHGEPNEFISHRLEVRIPDSTTPLGYRSYNYTTLDGPTDLPPTQLPITEVAGVPKTVDMDMDLSSDWDRPQPTLGDGDDEFEEEILDTLITGEGHSSWGSFKLRGRVRAWDGMIILVKEYVRHPSPLAFPVADLSPQDGPVVSGRGRWLYQGYLVSGGNWVGRWRDTFTSVNLSGYEGVFSVTRRY
ncbi:hypothetical protein FRC11_002753 [Ceratobasidium sp. 423]|nr:hypothetical protein FRC11_002753 [Ceratobasidium sp. 423]